MNERWKRGGRGPRRDAKPKPLGDKCNPACPFFRCSQNALMFTKKYQRGKMITVVMCRLVGDKCIGYKCQYAYCERKYLLPDGRCAWVLRKKESESGEDEFIKEMKEEERELGRIKNKLRDLDDLL